MDNITFEQIWLDNSFITFRVTVSSELVCAMIDLYISGSEFSALSSLLTSIPFPIPEKYESYWKSSEFSDTDTALSFKIIPKDKLGHLLIEVYMRVKDGGRDHNHHCCFFIQTESGLLDTFGKHLLFIRELPYGEKIALVNNE